MSDGDLQAPHDGHLIRVAGRPSRARNQLRLMSEHVLYEIEGFAATKSLLLSHGRFDERDFPEGSEAWWLGNITLESYLIRSRLLDEFLYGDVINCEGGRKQPIDLGDSTSALDFVVNQQAWLDERPRRSIDLRRRRINRAVVHLTWDRVEAGWEQEGLSSVHKAHVKGQVWPHGEVWDALRPPLVSFIEHLDDGVACDEFRERASTALSGGVLGD